jgi:putative endonuclease
MWFIYILRCSDESFYTGITTNINRRIQQHNSSRNCGAKYTRFRRPVNLVYTEESESRSSAGKREREIKRLSHKTKLKLIENSTTGDRAPR